MAEPAPNICLTRNTPERVSVGIPSFAFAANFSPSSLNPGDRTASLRGVAVKEEKMTWIRLYQEVLLEKVLAPVSRCAHLGLSGALAVAILPFVSWVLQLLCCQKRRRRDLAA